MSTNQDETRTGRQTPVSRRNLLQAGAAGLATVALFRDGVFSGIAEATQASTVPLAVGFNPATAGDLRVIDPAGLAHGNAGIAEQGASVRVLGLQPAGDMSILGQIESMFIDIAYPASPEMPFMAWSYNSRPVPQVSAPVTFRVPVAGSGLQMIVTYRLAGADEAVQAAVQLVTSDEAGKPKLETGTYLIVIPDDSHALPDWNQMQVVSMTGEDGQERPCLCDSGQAPSRCPHVAISIS